MLEVYDYVKFQLKKIFKNGDIELYVFTLLTAALVHVLFFGKELLLYFLYYVLVHFFWNILFASAVVLGLLWKLSNHILSACCHPWYIVYK